MFVNYIPLTVCNSLVKSSDLQIVVDFPPQLLLLTIARYPLLIVSHDIIPW